MRQDAFFDLRSKVLPLECASNSSGWKGDCDNGEVTDSDLVITKLNLTVKALLFSSALMFCSWYIYTVLIQVPVLSYKIPGPSIIFFSSPQLQLSTYFSKFWRVKKLDTNTPQLCRLY